jgi:Spy/CpxP family protein refolding chaperone
MNSNRKIIAGFLAASALMFGVAHAQGPGCPPDGMPGMKGGGMQRGGMMEPGARADQRLTRLKADLKLSGEQEPLWQAYADKVKAEAGKGMQAMRRNMQGDKPLPAPERMAQMEGMMKERLAAMQSVHESFNRLYAALTPEQKATADKSFGMAGRHQHGGRGGPRQGQPPAAPAKS